jgi:arginase
LPIVLPGNCSATVGVVAGLNATGLGVIWFDAHGDCETPESTTSGFLDGMGISMLLNSCWQNLLSVHNLTSPLRGKNIALVGVRDLSKHEEMFLKTNGIHRIMVEDIKRSSAGSIKAIYDKLVASGVHKIHLHVDVDVIDPVVAPSNSYAIADGLDKNELIEIVKACIGKMPLTSVTIASYDPSFDTNGHMRQLINELIEVIVR